eukprot:2469768-Heterocapsa_arctica.AAC.1
MALVAPFAVDDVERGDRAAKTLALVAPSSDHAGLVARVGGPWKVQQVDELADEPQQAVVR